MVKIRGGMLGLVILFAVFAALPFVLGEYHLNVLVSMLIWVIAAASYRLITYVNEWSIVHVVAMGIGAYTSALLAINLGFSFWVSAPLGGLAAAGFAAATAYPLFS